MATEKKFLFFLLYFIDVDPIWDHEKITRNTV